MSYCASRRSYGENIASMAWGARNLISTQELLSPDLLDVLKQVQELNPGKSDPQPQQRLIWRGGGDLCGNQISGAPRHRRDVFSVAAAARRRGGSRRYPHSMLDFHAVVDGHAVLAEGSYHIR